MTPVGYFEQKQYCLSCKIMSRDLGDSYWYFAYGSNMSLTVLTDRRNIHPLQIRSAIIEDHCLCFDVPGMPYTEPAMAGIRPKTGQDEISVHGVAYLLSPKDFAQLVESEG
jgi:3-methyladenine DNA glycosylase Mpg